MPHPPPDGKSSADIVLPHAHTSVATARARFADYLRAHGVAPRTVDDATLTLSELLSNAIKHARPLDGGLVRVYWQIDADVVEIAVTDGGAPTAPAAAAAATMAFGGRGLAIVRQIASNWGVSCETGDSPVTVWASVPLSRQSPANLPLSAAPRG